MPFVSKFKSHPLLVNYGTRRSAIVRCVGCDTEFRKPIRFLHTNKQHFCTKDCYAKWRRGPNHWRWMGGRNAAKRLRRKLFPELARHEDFLIRSFRRQVLGSHTLDQWEEKLRVHCYQCFACGSTERLTRDHIIPVTKGGTNDIANIQPLCLSCNARKGNRTSVIRLIQMHK